jgi:type IV secretion system protein VirB4
MATSKTAPPKQTKKKQGVSSKELEKFEDISDDVIESDFVPYACLYDPSTIATKDGELLQTIKITGLGYDVQAHGNLRTAIRTAIKKTIPDDRYAIWLHTLRRKQTSGARTHFPDPFSGKIDEAWRANQPSSICYTNELYVSIVRAGEPAELKNFKLFKQSLLPNRNRTARSKALDQALKEINRTTAAMLTILNPFGARLLTLVEREGIFYSEQMEFLEKLINLEERPMAVPDRDLSHVLTSGEITFGFNAMEVRSADGVRRFAAILTLKEYKESTLAGIDKFLEIPCELIVSQCFDFTGAAEAQAAYEKQAKYLTYSGDKELAKWMEIDRLMGIKGSELRMAFGQQQTSIFLIATSITQLESNVHMVQRALNRLGLIVVREDMRFEECYWSQLPANFTFIARKQAVDTDHLAGFVNLQAAPMGNAVGSPWGPPVTVFTTVQDAPYYFNFHRESSAHTIVLGKAGTGRTSFTHFLLAQARKLPISIWYLDVNGRAAPFITAMGGQALNPGTADCKLNPLLLPETPANREFLALWLATLVDPSGLQLNRSTLSFFQYVIDTVLQLPREQRRMSAMVAVIREADGLLANSLQRYVAGGEFGDLFDMAEDTFQPGKLSVWNIGRWMDNPATRAPLTGYLLHRLTGALNRTPTMIVLDEGFDILNTPLFSARAAGWCDYLAQNNAAMMLSASDIDRSADFGYCLAVAARAATIFAMPDKDPGAAYSMGFGFTPEDINSLGYIQLEQRHVLQKRGAEAVVIRAGLTGIPTLTMQTLRGKTPSAAPSPADTLAQLMGRTPQAVG